MSLAFLKLRSSRHCSNQEKLEVRLRVWCVHDIGRLDILRRLFGVKFARCTMYACRKGSVNKCEGKESNHDR